MNHLRVAGGATVAMFVFASAAFAANNTLRCFSDAGSVCSASGDTATFQVLPEGYAGVYINSKPNSAKGLASRVFSFTATATSTVAGGAPRFSIPINTSGGNTVDGYAFLDVAGCGSTTVSTNSLNCHVNFQGVDYANWAEFAALFPDGRIAPGAIPFIISDQPGNYAIYAIVLR